MAQSMEKLPLSEDAPIVMSLQLLKKVTNNFSKERKVGSGTYGEVYKGVHNGIDIAVKMLHLTPGLLHDGEQFKKEFENLLRLRHQNIVQLLGYCYETRHEYVYLNDGRTVFAENISRALCFEYMHNGSLQKHLCDEHHGFDWQTRYKIIKGVCDGLKYLHEGLENLIYHLDLKPDNILLDKNMVPKLADFGLSKLVLNDKTQATLSPIGTWGYLPPEYIEKKLISKKLDIFSLGVIMIRIIAGYEGYYKKDEMSFQEFIDLVQTNWRSRLKATPRCISLEYVSHQVKRCTEIALDCVKDDRNKRPDIGAIVQWLNETEHMTDTLANNLSTPNTGHGRVSHEEKTGPIITDAAMGRIAQISKVISEGGYDKIFKQTFECLPDEKLKEAYMCYLETSRGPIMGVLYISTLKIAFGSDSPVTFFNEDNKTESSFYKVVLPLAHLRSVTPTASKKKPSEMYIQVVLVDNNEFWFMGFVNYGSAVKNLESSRHIPCRAGPSITDTTMGRIAQISKVISEGGYDKIFKLTFECLPDEKLKKTYVCYLSASHGPIMGVLYISTAKIAFGSDSPMTYLTEDNKTASTFYKVVLPLAHLRSVTSTASQENPSNMYIQVVSVDNDEFWFMGFVSYGSAVKNLQEAVRGARRSM